ncbi:hypothetical protein D1BOALGB6SA_3413 [Olavius sp. associated proteobacterium Delta 1]|nr:hypothetical protein D1BOALGB6SA_3413 [Olavius sp. associated proteobacterium Delta 1]
MNITVSIHEIISWLLTVAVFTLYLIERRKNSATPFYMALQGVLRACREKSGHLAVLTKSIKEDQREAIPKTEILLYLDISQTEYFAMMQQIMGTMNAILPFDSISYDIDEFTNSKSMENFDVPPS